MRWLETVRLALAIPSFASDDRLSGAQAIASDLMRTGSRSERLRIGWIGLVIGALISYLGYLVGLAIENLLYEVTDGTWELVSRYGQEIGLLPWVFTAWGWMIALSGADRVLTAAFPSLAKGSGLPRLVRLGAAVLLGTVVAVSVVLLGIVSLPS